METVRAYLEVGKGTRSSAEGPLELPDTAGRLDRAEQGHWAGCLSLVAGSFLAGGCFLTSEFLETGYQTKPAACRDMMWSDATSWKENWSWARRNSDTMDRLNDLQADFPERLPPSVIAAPGLDPR